MSRYALKWLDEGAVGPYSQFPWPRPNGKPGKWVAVKGDLKACERGIHAATLEQSMGWLREECYLIELGGRVIDARYKLVARRGRLVRRVETWKAKNARLFTADCAEHVLPIFERSYPNDQRPRKAIEVARRYARGKATDEELAAAWTAARAAASDAAWTAARAAAWTAARAAAWSAAGYAAWSAADAAASDAAWAATAAAPDAARAAERTWQSRRLAHYLGKDIVAALEGSEK